MATGQDRAASANRQTERWAGLVDVAQALHALRVVDLLAQSLTLVQLHKVHPNRCSRWPSCSGRKGARQQCGLADPWEGASEPCPVEVVVDAHAVRLALQVAAPILPRDANVECGLGERRLTWRIYAPARRRQRSAAQGTQT